MAPILGIYASQISGHLFAPSGAYDSIATVTVGGGGSSSISFTSIPATYTHLQVRLMARTNRAAEADFLTVTFNSDSGSNYSYHYLQGDGSSASASNSSGSPYILLNRFASASATSSVNGVGVLDVLDYANTNKFKTSRSLAGYDNNGSGVIEFDSGNWRNTAAISTLTITPGAGTAFVQYSSFALYGIKGN
jgi:hypothetical protein